MTNSEMILRLLTDLKVEQQALREQLEKMQTTLTTLEEKTVFTKQRGYSGFPTSFRDWRAATQKD
ncbi:preprotein translocase [Bacillus clarus]|uniref:Preprotein translocase n=1 Tax=Bacillus clarus TaxID=2338372 RepID=A0A090YZX9_9BACI|nr:hypothetical protein [Bacillus clarus]KFN03648.1 hypothetical protein DJ93_3507 [Bacillus clarus]RFT66275.1 preprotein translocase [Bacillus clarus]